MANAVRYISVERGKDPREFALVVAGGAGPLHAGPIAAELDIPLVLVPRESSVFCAAGMIISDIKHDYVRTITRSLDAAAVEEANVVLAEMAREARHVLRAEGVDDGDIAMSAGADLHYVGQFHEVEVVASGTALDAAALADGFHLRHRELYGHAVPGAPLELINVRIRSVGKTSKPSFQSHPDAGPDASGARKGERVAYFDGEPHQASVYDGLALRHGNRLAGPALVEQPTTTIVVPSGYVLECDEYDNYVLHSAELTLSEARSRLHARAISEPIGA
jgi:N-methylhydantoinase A